VIVDRWDEPNPSAGVLILYVSGGGALVFTAASAIEGRSSDRSVAVFQSALPVLLSTALLIATGWVDRSNLPPNDERRIVVWCFGGILAISSVGLFSTIVPPQGPVMNLGPIIADLFTGGALVGLLIGVYDAEQNRSKRQLAAERERSADIRRRLQILNRVLRHDVRNDLNVIAGYADLLTTEDASVDELATAIKRKSTEVVELSDQAREIERTFQLGEPDLRPVDIGDVIRTEIDRIDRDYVGVEIEADVPEHCWVYASKLIGSAIDNVLENAAEHGDRPTTEVEVSVDRTAEGVVFITVVDNGPGIPESELGALDRAADHRLRHSSGLGLWLVNWIVEESNGRLRFDTNDPRGTIVTIELPTVREESTADPDSG